MKKENAVIVALAVLAAVAATVWLLLTAPELTGNAMVSAIPQNADPFELRIVITWIFLVIGIGVFIAMFSSILLHRKSSNHAVAKLSHSTFAEIIWTLIPILILVGMALPATSELLQIQPISSAP